MNYSGSSLQKAFKDLQSKILNFQSFDNALGGICEKYWLISKNKRYLFKYPDRFLNSIEPKFDYSDFGEVFTSYLSYYLGFKCVKSIFYQGVFDDKSWGTLVEDFRNKNVVETVSLRLLKEKYKYDKVKYSCDAVFKICKFFAEDNNLKIDENLEQELKEMALMDYLLIQTDRHASNIEFLIEKNKMGEKVLKLAPMFDNGFCLFLNYSEKDIALINSSLKTGNNYYSNGVLEKTRFYIAGKNKTRSSEEDYIVENLALEILRNKKLELLYDKFKELDFEAEINFICSIYKRKLPEIFKETLLLGVKDRVKQLDLEICKQSMKYAKEREE